MIWQPRTKRRPPVRISFYSGSTVLPAKDWSPEQIPGWLKQSYPDDESLRLSHETIYRTLFLQARGALKQELVRHMRSQRRIRRSRRASIHRAIARPDRRCRLHSGEAAAGLEVLRSSLLPTRVRSFSWRARRLAARFKRKYERTAAAIPAEKGGFVLLLTGRSGRDRAASRSASTENVGISNSGGQTAGQCCVDPLRPPDLSGPIRNFGVSSRRPVPAHEPIVPMRVQIPVVASMLYIETSFELEFVT
jgi:hypothetical protein